MKTNRTVAPLKIIIATLIASVLTGCTTHIPPSLLDINESKVIVRYQLKDSGLINTATSEDVFNEAERGCALFDKHAKFISKNCSSHITETYGNLYGIYSTTSCIFQDHLFVCQ